MTTHHQGKDMTDQNKSAQPAEQDLAHEIWAAAQTPPGDSVEAAVTRISALLSKLRAPVADERDRNATISQIVGLCNRIPGATTWNAAEFMYDEMHRRAALASAPVAGEAQKPFAWVQEVPGHEPRVFLASRMEDPSKGHWRADVRWRALVLADAAPQASEAVRNARTDGFIAGFICAGGDAEDAKKQAPQLQACIDACTPQADKDGGDCAKGAGDEDEQNAEAWLIEWQPGDGNTWVEADANEVRAREKAKRMGGTATPMVRAALAAQPSGNSEELAAQKHPRTDGGGRE
jgi:hypothetical protein